MIKMSYRDFENEIERLSLQESDEDILELLEGASEILSEQDYRQNFFNITANRSNINYRLGRKDEFTNIFEQLIDAGYACGAWMVRKLDMEDERCKRLKERNEALIAEAQEVAELRYVVHVPEGYEEGRMYPVFLAMHGDGGDGNIEDFSRHFKPDVFIKNGFICVYIQSSQVYCHNGYQWNRDINIARRDVLNCLEGVAEEYSIDRGCVVIGGFSGGAMASVDFAMGNVLPIRGFISLCPGGIGKYFTREKVMEAAKRGVRGVVFEGEIDLEPSVQSLIKVFDEIGFSYEYVIDRKSVV